MQGCSNFSTHTMSKIKGGGGTFDNRAVLKLVDNLTIQSRAGKTSDNSLLDTAAKGGAVGKATESYCKTKVALLPPTFLVIACNGVNLKEFRLKFAAIKRFVSISKVFTFEG